MINESVIDPIQEKRMEELFDKDENIKKEARSFILDNFYKWLDKQGYKFEDVVKKIEIEGSSVGFQYTENSDIDVAIVSSIPDDKIAEIHPKLPNGKKLGSHPVNYYLLESDHMRGKSDNIYDVINSKWIKKQDRKDVKQTIPFTYLMEISKFFIAGAVDRIREFETDKIELEYLKKQPEDEEIKNIIELKEKEIKADLDAIYIAESMLKAFRTEAYGKKNQGGYYPSLIIQIKDENFSDPNHSINNCIYKQIEETGLLDKIEEYLKIRNKIIEKQEKK